MNNPIEPSRQAVEFSQKLRRARPWVQTAFAAVWLAPMGRWLHSIPGCVFHCYSCPLSAFACPVGVAANYAALVPAVSEVPYLLLGILLAFLVDYVQTARAAEAAGRRAKGS